MNNVSKKLLLIITVFILVLGVFVILHNLNPDTSNSTPRATVTLTYNVGSLQDTSVRFNNLSLKPTNNSNTYDVLPGAYTLTVSKPGYRQFSASFNAKAGQSFIINVQLQLESNPQITAIGQIPTPSVAGATITNTTYFYGKTWAALTVQKDNNSALVVVQYNPGSQTWSTMLGPGTSFSESDTQNLPAQVESYLAANNYINPGS